MKKTAIILAGGSGTRAGGDVPKQLQLLDDVPVFLRSIWAFHAEDPEVNIILVVNAKYKKLFEQYLEDWVTRVRIVEGGATRPESVMKGLSIASDQGLVAIHDAARPRVSPALIHRGWQEAAGSQGAIPVVPLTDSIRHITDSGSVSVPRAEYVAVQTPQFFTMAYIKLLYKQIPPEIAATLTDDASLVDRMGGVIKTFPGDPANRKITNPEDLKIMRNL